MDELEQLLTELAKKFGEAKSDEDKGKIAAALKSKVKPLWQEAFNEGHGVATAQLTSKLTSAEEARDAAETARKNVEKELNKLKAEQPSAAELHESYGAKLQEKEAEIEQLKTTFKQEKLDSQKNMAITRLRAELAAYVDEDYAEVLVQKPSVRERFQFDDGENLRVMQASGNIPFAGDAEAQIKAITEELVKDVKPIFKRTNVGAGSGRESAGGEGGPSKGKALYEKIRADAKNSQTGDGKDPQKKLHERLGQAQPA